MGLRQSCRSTGGGDIFLDMKKLVLKDQDEARNVAEPKVCVEVFDSDFACVMATRAPFLGLQVLRTEQLRTS